MDPWGNKVALVTGANSGIGLAITEELVRKGMKVVGLSSSVNKVKILAEQLKTMPGKLHPLQCDLENEKEICQAVEWVQKNLGTVDVLVNNAAIDMRTMFMDGSMEEWHKTFNINVIGLTQLTKEVLMLMKNKGMNCGHIINVNDICGLKLPTGSDCLHSAPYTSSKFALRAITNSLRTELAQVHSKIKVSSIYPGLVETEMTMKTLKEHPRISLRPKDVADAICCMIDTPETVVIQDLVITPIHQLF